MAGSLYKVEVNAALSACQKGLKRRGEAPKPPSRENKRLYRLDPDLH